jgi:hypothetical protein
MGLKHLIAGASAALVITLVNPYAALAVNMCEPGKEYPFGDNRCQKCPDGYWAAAKRGGAIVPEITGCLLDRSSCVTICILPSEYSGIANAGANVGSGRASVGDPTNCITETWRRKSRQYFYTLTNSCPFSVTFDYDDCGIGANGTECKVETGSLGPEKSTWELINIDKPPSARNFRN